MSSIHSLKSDPPINLVRTAAEEMLPTIMKKLGVDDTAENREDMLAITLNSIPAKYVTTDSGRQYAQLVDVYMRQHEADITAALTRAAIRVRQRPRGYK
ncbi:MAG: late competence development ComFB family protein [Clostridiales Family XIII bacterium]|jgi:competence protein ComFB|nr:late competence development ComFB family protein [Clostridiales Family XIII bacterium]